MKTFCSLLSVLILIKANSQCSVQPQSLQCEYLVKPLGMDEPSPRLSWTLKAVNTKSFGQRQTAYQIVVCEQRSDQTDTVWNTGWKASSLTNLIAYKGETLKSDRRYIWHVRVKDEQRRVSAWSDTAYWNTGLFKPADWTASWIGSGETLALNADSCTLFDPWFRKTVELTEQPKKAMFFLASVGYHELYINGQKISDEVLAPAVSDHSRRARYRAYDIAKALHPGKNQLAIWLGTGWSVFSSYMTTDKPRAPIVIGQADIYYAYSTITPALRITTDASWKTHPSPNQLLENWSFAHMGGELWDAQKEVKNWNQLQFDDRHWKKSKVYFPRLMLSSQMVESNYLFNEIRPVAIEEKPDGSYRVDMGVNFAGWTEVKLKGEPGRKIDMLFSERENETVTFNIRNAYIPGSSGEGTFRNRFNYSSGRWITIRGATKKPELSDIRGWNIRTGYESPTTFSCSDSLQNWIYDRIRWNFENLTIGGYVVDCSSRERLGYGDADAFAETGMMNYRLGAMFTKWLEDWRDVQGTKAMDHRNYGGVADEGILPHTAPTYQGGGGPGWGGMCVMYPWLIYQYEGDRRVLEKNFITMKRWLAFLDQHTQTDHLMTRFGGDWDFLGDWLWPNATAEGMNNDKPENICFNNCYRVYNLRTAAKIARLLNKQTEAMEWETKAKLSATAIHKKYFNEGDDSYADSSMGNMAAALLAEVPPRQFRAQILKRIEKEILVVRKGHIHAGITAGAILFKVLRDANRDDLIYSMTSQTSYPGWGYMKANGATSLWEMWEKDLAGHSLLHSSFLYPGAWYIDGLAGIKPDPHNTGFQNFIVRPPQVEATQVKWVKAVFLSPAGYIHSEWKREKSDLTIKVVVPPNTSATVFFPCYSPATVSLSSPFIRNKGFKDGFLQLEMPAGTYQISGKESR